jgi:hypothetical protein
MVKILTSAFYHLPLICEDEFNMRDARSMMQDARLQNALDPVSCILDRNR